jgi:predicted glycogen debranching enzyme
VAASGPAPVFLERSELVDVASALGAEWCLSNGRGGYAASTALGVNTRSSHGLLVATGESGPRVLVPKVDEEVELDERDDGERIALSTNEYHDGTLHPSGHLHLQSCVFDDARVGWRWHARDVGLEKTIAVARGQARTIVRYRLFEARFPIRLRVAPFLADRAPDACTLGTLDWSWTVDHRRQGIVARAHADSTPVGLFAWQGRDCRLGRRPGRFVDTGLWYWRFLHRADRAEGRAHLEDLYTPGLMVFDLQPGEGVWLALTADPADIAAPERIDPEADLDAASRPVPPAVRLTGRATVPIAS